MKRPLKSSKLGDALQRAVAAVQGRQPAEAERIARELVTAEPQHPGALHVLGLALLAQGRAREAVAPLEQAAQCRADPVIETQLAIALRQSGRTAQAIEVLQQATARQPPFAPAFQQLAALLGSLSRLAEAQAALERAVALAPAVPDLSVLLGGVLLERADRAGAKLAFARALANAPGHPSALYGLGSVLKADGEFAPAAERFRQALARDPGYAQAQLGLAACLVELDRWDEALAALRAVVKAAPQLYAQALHTLATAGRGRFWLKPSVAASMLKS